MGRVTLLEQATEEAQELHRPGFVAHHSLDPAFSVAYSAERFLDGGDAGCSVESLLGFGNTEDVVQTGLAVTHRYLLW